MAFLSEIRADISGYFLMKYYGRKKFTSEPFDMGRRIASSEKTLICMPVDPEQYRIARYVFKRVLESDESKRVTIVVSAEGFQDLKTETDSRIYVLNKYDLDFWRLPLPEWMAKLSGTGYDVALDLNLQFHLPSAYIVRKTGVGLRVGFAWEGASAFYNALIERRNEKSLLEKNYRTMRDELTNLVPLDVLTKK